MTKETGHPRQPFDLTDVPEAIIEAYHLERLPLDRPNRSTTDLLSLDGKVALVTGGGGQGLGNAICHRLAEAGASIAVLDIDEAAAATATKELIAIWNVESTAVVANVADWDEAHQAVRTVVDQLGTVDILVNNAGGFGSRGAGGRRIEGRRAFASMSQEAIDLDIGVNLLGTLYTTKAALSVMMPEHKGRIINIASEGGKIGMTDLVVYNASKSAVIGFTRNLAHEIGPEGVSIVAVCPGTMITKRSLDFPQHFSPTLEGNIGNAFRRSTIGRFSLPDEVASVVAFLASEAGAYIHGTAVSVGGGLAD